MAGAKILPVLLVAALACLLLNTIAWTFAQPQLRGSAVAGAAVAASTVAGLSPQAAEAVVESEAGQQIQGMLEQTATSVVLADGLPFAVNGGLVFVTAAFSMSIALVVWGRNGF
mmetsp:Transcript_52307/g.113374  ORF Transcript_52307/g.113374 Transcript_52307/m.113374 type:complete len:114 (-) Transcript_52307:96-437(-)